MLLNKKDSICHEDFTVVDTLNNLITGIPTTEFTYKLYNNSGLEVTGILVTFDELGNGNYRASFIPDGVGTWLLVVYHPTYFSWGKSGTIKVYKNDFDTIANDLLRVLGLMQENYYLDNAVYDTNNNLTSCRMRIYENSGSVGTNSDIIATYNMESTYDGLQLETYKMEKI